MSPDKQVVVLYVPDAVSGFANKRQPAVVVAKAVLAMIKELSRKQQAAVLSAPDAVSKLARAGQSRAVLAVIEELSPDQQAAVLSAREAVSELADNGQAEAVERLKAGIAAKRPPITGKATLGETVPRPV